MAKHRRLAALIGTLSATAVAFATVGATASPEVMSMTTPLSGAEEVPAVDTNARGVAVIHLGDDGQSLAYRLIVANIEDVTMAHIHVGAAGEIGPVVAWLYPEAPPPQLIPGRFDGTLATGTITADDLVGPLEGADFDVLLDAIREGNAYVNVHTDANPGGEVRGQIPGTHGPGSHG